MLLPLRLLPEGEGHDRCYAPLRDGVCRVCVGKEDWNVVMSEFDHAVVAARPKTIYIAGSRHDRPLVHQLVEAVREAGYEVTYDWTTHAGWEDPNPSHELLREAASTDVSAIFRAEVFWYVAPERLSEGSATELGIALATRMHRRLTVVVSGPHAHDHLRIFPRLADFTFETHDEALAHLRGLV